MRKLFNIFLFVLCIVAIAGCNDTESSEFKLEIKAVNTNFQATGGKGYIQLQSTGNITADVDVDWCVLRDVENALRRARDRQRRAEIPQQPGNAAVPQGPHALCA